MIKNSSQIIKIIIENAGITSDPYIMESNLKNIKNEKSNMFKILNNTENSFLEEVIMNIFERKIAKYFELIPNLEEDELKNSYKTYYEQNKKGRNKTGIIFDKSFLIFEQTIKNLDSFSKLNNKKQKEKNSTLLKLYSVVYVKMYLNYLSNFIVNNYQEMKSINNIMDCIKNITNKEFAKVIKIYILKLIFNLKNNNFEEFKKEFEQKEIYFYKEIEGEKKAKDIILTYFFLPSEEEEFNKYGEILDAYIKNVNFNLENKDLENLLEKYGLNLFLLMILNKVISNLALKDFESKDTYINFSKYAKSIFIPDNNKKYNKELCQLLYLFFDKDTYNKKLKPFIREKNGKIDIQVFEALLYGFRFCINSLYSEKNENIDIKNLLFSSILSKDYAKKTLGSSLIPGVDNKEDLHLTTLEAIQNHFNEQPDGCGCYVCSCGFYYFIDPCGFPTTNRSFNCPECGKKCGWDKKKVPGGASNHGMVVRPGHYRIFKNQEQKVSQMSRWHDPEENIPNKLLDVYIKEVIDPIRKQSSFGFNIVERDYFERKDKKVRKLSNIGYRLLNFISY